MIYLDTSVAVALFALEQKTAGVKTWFAGLSAPLVMSDWLLTEFSSALSIKERCGELSATHANRVRKEFDVFSAGQRIVPVSRAAFHAAAALASKPAHGLRAGDALHLAVAKEVGAKSIATLDGRMADNAKRLKMRIEAI